MTPYKYIIGLISLICLTACSEDFMQSPGTGGSKFAITVENGGDYTVTRAAQQPKFHAGTLFHLYGTKSGATEDWSRNYLSLNASETTVAKAVAISQEGNEWILGNDATSDSYKGCNITNIFNDEPLNFYGVTAVGTFADEQTDEEATNNVSYYNGMLDTFFPAQNQETGIPEYDVTYQLIEGKGRPLPDIMWSDSCKNLTPFEHAGKITMPFKHTLSKLNFFATILNDGSIDETIKIKALTVWDYDKATFNMADGMYKGGSRTLDSERGYRATPIQALNLGDDADKHIQVEKEPSYTKFATCLVFPTEGAKYASPFAGTETDSLNNRVTVDLTITVNGVEKTFYKIPLKYTSNQPEVFHPDREYNITFTLTANSVVVTFMPEYYEYIEHTTTLRDWEVGEPIDFGGVLWAASNLGATACDATAGALAWEYSRGFYYQYGRNIPFYARRTVLDPHPYAGIHTGTDDGEWWEEKALYLYTGTNYEKDGLTENVPIPYGNTVWTNKHNHGARLYPYIPVLWERETTPENFLKEYVPYLYGSDTGQDTPTECYSDPYKANEEGQYNKSGFALSRFSGTNRPWDAKNAKASTNWDSRIANYSPKNSPAPKGWRLPTRDEFLSIIPSSTKVGDISFCGKASEGSGPHCIASAQDETSLETAQQNVERVYMHEVTDESDYEKLPAVYVGIYQDGGGTNDLEFNPDGKYREGWGSVYAIKRYKHSNAYAIRWQIIIADKEEFNKDQVVSARPLSKIENEDGEKRWYLGRGVLVISKYDLDGDVSKVRLEAVKTGATIYEPTDVAEYTCYAYIDKNSNDKYDSGEEAVDWDNPSGQIYLPISGYSLATSSGGQALIYPGCEGIYWTADRGKNEECGVSIRMKYAGDYLSRYIYMDNEEVLANGCQIRCVRDTKAGY